MTRLPTERGGVTTIVAILLSMGVFLGFAAIAIDTGTILVERRELQNSADAAALSLAASCAEDASNCVPDADNLYDLANKNSRDGVTNVAGECVVNLTGTGLPECPDLPSSMDQLTECGPLPPALSAVSGLPYVEVRTMSQRPTTDGGVVDGVAHFLAGKVMGGDDSTDVKACARAAWGSPISAAAISPLTISMCEWRTNTGADVGEPVYQDPPIYGAGMPDGYGAANPWPTESIRIFLKGNIVDGCAPKESGWGDRPGGFGYINDCGISPAAVGNWYPGNTGLGSCAGTLKALVGNVIDIPVYDCVTNPGSVPSGGGPPTATTDCGSGNGSNVRYHIVGFAKFYFAGHHIQQGPGMAPRKASGWTGPMPDCGPSQPCIAGWFVQGTLSDSPGAVAPPGEGFGVSVIVPAG